jgi:hypothetical protein
MNDRNHLCLFLKIYFCYFFYLMKPVDTQKRTITGLQSLAGMVADSCFQGHAVFYLLKSIQTGIQDVSITNKRKYITWMSLFFQEISLKILHHPNDFALIDEEEKVIIKYKVQLAINQ